MGRRPPLRPFTMKRHNQSLGAWGERVAATYLEAHGYTILARNWRCPQGEIDLVAHGPDGLVLAEVKTRRGLAAGAPEEAITPRKAERLRRLAEVYLAEQGSDEVEVRIDVLAVELDAGGKLLRCEHYINAVAAW